MRNILSYKNNSYDGDDHNQNHNKKKSFKLYITIQPNGILTVSYSGYHAYSIYLLSAGLKLTTSKMNLCSSIVRKRNNLGEEIHFAKMKLEHERLLESQENKLVNMQLVNHAWIGLLCMRKTGGTLICTPLSFWGRKSF